MALRFPRRIGAKIAPVGSLRRVPDGWPGESWAPGPADYGHSVWPDTVLRVP